MLTDEIIALVIASIPEPIGDDAAVWVSDLCFAIEAEVRGQDDALIWLMLTALEHHTEQTRPIARTDDAITAALLRLKGDHIAHARNMMQIAVEPDEVLLALKRPEGYEDVHPELVAADALPSTPFEYRVAWPLGVDP